MEKQDPFDNLEFDQEQAKKQGGFENIDYTVNELIRAVQDLKAELRKRETQRRQKELNEYNTEHRHNRMY